MFIRTRHRTFDITLSSVSTQCFSLELSQPEMSQIYICLDEGLVREWCGTRHPHPLTLMRSNVCIIMSKIRHIMWLDVSCEPCTAPISPMVA